MIDVEQLSGVFGVMAVAIGGRSVLKGIEWGVAAADLHRVLTMVADGREDEEELPFLVSPHFYYYYYYFENFNFFFLSP